MDSFYPLVAALLSNFVAQVLKPFVLYMRTQKFDIHQCIADVYKRQAFNCATAESTIVCVA